MTKLNQIWITATAVLLLTSCAGVRIEDVQFCNDEGQLGAHCDNFLTDAPIDIPQPAWDAQRFGMSCFSDEAKGNMKREIEQLCSKTKCSAIVKKKIDEAFAKMGVK